MSDEKASNGELRGRLTDPEAVAKALRNGQADAVVTERDVLLLRLKDKDREAKRLRKAIETTKEAIGLISPDLAITYANNAMCNLFGYTPQEMIGKHVSTLNAGPYPEATAQKIASTIEKQGWWEGEIVNKRKDGTEFTSYAAVSAVKDEEGKITSFISTQHDITERKQTEEALRESQRQVSIRNSIAEIFLTTPDDEMYGEVLEVLLEAMESKYGIFGYIDEHERLIIPSMTRDIWAQCQVPDKTIVYPREKWRGIWGRALKEKKSLYANEGLHVPKGHIPITKVLVVPVMYGGEVIGLLQVANKSIDYIHKDQEFLESIAGKIAPILNARLQRDREERERKQAEEALKLHELRLKSLLDLNKMAGATQREILEFVREEAVKITRSKFAFIGFMNEDESVQTTYAWSKEVMSQCALLETPRQFPVAEAGLWSETVRQRRPIIINDYAAHPRKKGYPKGHVPITRFLCIPVFDGERIALVAGVANKEADYDESDVRALMSMMNDTWRLIRYEEAEQTLREREDKYRAIFEQAADSIVLIDAESGDLVEFNDRAHDILGYTREEFRTLKIPDFEIIESAEQVSKHIKNIVAKGADNFETKHKAKNGKVHNILVSSRAISIGDKDFIMSIWRDFTERKQAEEALKRSEERYALAQRAANIGSWDWDITTDKLVWSDQIEPMFGFGRGEFGATYEAFLECVHPDDRKHVVDSVDACVQEGKDYAIEHRIVWPDGTIRWLSETGDVIRDEGGKAIRMLGIVQDITHHKLAIEQIENLAKFPSEDPSPVLRIAKNGVVLYANSASDSLLAEWGCKVGQTALKNWCRIVSDVFASGSARSIEVAHADSIFAFMIVPVVEADYVNLYGRDITDTKKAQEVLRASEEQFRRAVLDSPLPIMIHAEDGEVLQISKVWTDLTGYTPEEIPTLSAWTEQAYGDRKDIVKSQIDKIFDYDTKVEEGEYVISSKDGETLIWDFSSAPLGKLPDGRRLVISMATDITERKEIASRQELAGRVLELLNQKSTSPDLIHDVIKLIKESTGFEAVGVRLHEGEDFPYFGAKGFPKDFIEDENYLCARNEKGEQVLDEEGHPVLSCMCGSVIIGHADPDLPFFTEGGSFWTNSTTELQSSASLDTLQVPLRNRCNEAGYESVALIPLRSGYEIVGLLQLNDSRPGRFTPEMVRSFERIGASIGIALARIKAEENIHNLAKFPSENPSPVLRIAKEGTVLYANAAGSEFLKTWGCNIGEQVPEHWHKYVLRILKSGLNEELEASCGDRNFSLIIAPVVEAGYVNTYGVDITERKLAEEDLRQYRQHLEELVETRTGELTQANRQLLQEIEARKGLEKEILNVSEQERRKIGQELHDSLGQQLTGVAFMTKVLEQKLSKKSLNESADVAEIAQLVNQATHQARSLAKGLHPIDLETGTLMSSLQELAESTETLFGINCTFKCDKRIRVDNPEVAVHLYRITQEAITNAIKHGKAKNIQIDLTYDANKSILTVRNDGIDFPKEFEARNTGMGLQIMDHRVDIIEGSLDIHKGPKGGTIMTCTFPIKRQ